MSTKNRGRCPTKNAVARRGTEDESRPQRTPVHEPWIATVRGLLALAAVGEAATGVALLLMPSLVGQLLLGAELSGTAAAVARVAGIALVGLALACWPPGPRAGMLFYVAAAALYLGYLGLVGGATGALLWPAVLLHVVLAVLLARRPAKPSPPTTK
jgi:hypothetical protein